MYKFTTEDLAYAGYFKNEKSKHEELQSPQNCTTIDKIVELEVLQFCNQFLNKYKVPKTKTSFQKVEALLQHTELENETDKEKIADWIATNWIKK